jgi:phospholipid-binding lipoprotein MlaA
MFKPLMIVLMFVFLTACSTTGKNKQDPWEGWNRGVYKLNKAVDKVAKPVAQGYRYVTPDVVETGISNIFSNIGDIPNMLNNLLQGKFVDSASDLGRFLVNSTIGLAGIWDPASSMGLEKHDEDFGQTLATWGVKPGPYVMLPFLGPSTFRDTIAFPVDNLIDPLNEVEHVPTRNQIRFVDLVELRASLLSYDEQLQGQMDEYAFIRDVYLQNRQFKVLDGEIAFDDDDEEDDEWE